VIRKQIGRNLGMAIVLAGIGIAWLSRLGPSHSLCGSVLVSSLDQSACQGDAVRWYLAWGLVLIGVTFGILAVIGYVKNDELLQKNQHCLSCGSVAQISANNCSNCGASLKKTKHD